MRSQLRIADLKGGNNGASKVLSVRVPAHILEAIDQVAKELDASKTDVTVALLNEGLHRVRKKLGG